MADALVVDELLAPVAERAGWVRACVEVEYVKGDEGKPDAILVILHGERGGSSPVCKNPRFEQDSKRAASRAAGPRVLKELGLELKRAILSTAPRIRERILMNTDVIELGDGWGGAATVRLR